MRHGVPRDVYARPPRKRQYWVKEGASWKISYEGAG